MATDKMEMTALVVSCFILGTMAEICDNQDCIDLSNTIQFNMDPSADPCEDFYQFACGGYLNKTVIPAYQGSWSISSQINLNIINTLIQDIGKKTLDGQPALFQNAKDFYQTCMDTDAIEKTGLKDMKKRLKKYGGWPVLDDDWDESTFDWIVATKVLSEAGEGVDFFFDLAIAPNDHNVKETLITLKQPSLGLDRNYLLNGTDDPLVKIYHDVMVDIAVEFGARKSEAKKQMTEALEFEIELAKIFVSSADLRDLGSIVQVLKISELQANYSDFKWLSFFTSVYGEDAKLTKDDKIEVYSPTYVEKLGPVLAKTSARVVANFMFGRVVFSRVQLLTQRLADINQKLLNAQVGVTEAEPRPIFCISELKDRIVGILAAEFVQNHFSPKGKKIATEIVKMTRKKLLKVISDANWLDSTTRTKALEKAKNIALMIGYPDQVLDNKLLSKYYKKLTIGTSDFYGNVLSASLFDKYIGVSKLHKPYNTRRWSEQSLLYIVENNAQYLRTANAIDIFAGHLQGMSFNINRPLYLNIAALTRTVGHELTHSVDDRGGQFDKIGNLVNWWSNNTKEVFKKKKQAIIDQYSTYLVKAVNLKLKPANMVGEIIADQGGYKIGFMTYEAALAQQQSEDKKSGKTSEELGLIGLERYSAKQLYWIIAASGTCSKINEDALRASMLKDTITHPPSEVRVNGPLRNSERFAKFFDCSVGSPMNPKDKVNLW